MSSFFSDWSINIRFKTYSIMTNKYLPQNRIEETTFSSFFLFIHSYSNILWYLIVISFELTQMTATNWNVLVVLYTVSVQCLLYLCTIVAGECVPRIPAPNHKENDIDWKISLPEIWTWIHSIFRHFFYRLYSLSQLLHTCASLFYRWINTILHEL